MSVDSTMPANDHFEDVLPGIFAETEGVSLSEGRPSRSTCSRVERVRPRPRVCAPASSLLLHAVADAQKSLLNQEIKENKPVKSNQVKDDQVKRLSNTSEESETQIIIKQEDEKKEKRKGVEELDPPVVKKRKIFPIVFNADKKGNEADKVRERTESASSDSYVTVNTVSHIYDSVPPLSAVKHKLVWCRWFPACRYGSACAFAHPRCKFLAACKRRNCFYSHSPSAPVLKPSSLHSTHAPFAPLVPLTPYAVHRMATSVSSIASHVVSTANYNSISAVVPKMCKFYPNCVNPACYFYHPKPCRYGNNCVSKVECKFHHAELTPKWRYNV